MDFNGVLPAMVPEGTYRAEDGLLHCSSCGHPRQLWFEFQGERMKVPCACGCVLREDPEADARRRRDDARAARCFKDAKGRGQTFEADDGRYGAEQMKLCKRWIDKLPGALDDPENPDFPLGLLLFGEPDAGKTFAANCIANAALEKGMTAVVRSVPWLLAQDIDERPSAIRQMQEADLLVLDDLGAERGTDYAKEIVYSVVDERYKARKLMVVTTNLLNSELADAQDMRDRRSYNRLLEVCYPLRFDTGRRRYSKSTIEAMRAAIIS